MKSTQLYITATVLLINSALAQKDTYPPTTSTTSLASDVLMHTIAPTDGVARFPRPTPVPGSETYWPTTESAFLDYDMQVVEVAGSPVPTVVRLDGESADTESGTGDQSDGTSAAANEDVPQNGAPTPSANEQPTNDGILRRNGSLEVFIVGIVAWLGFL
jgi:hypothetical protein